MSASVHVLPTRDTAQAMWQRYVDLCREAERNPRLRTDYDHNVRMVRAWAAFRDAYLKSCEAA